MIKMYYHTKTTAVTNAQKWLVNHDAEFDAQDIKKAPLDKEEIMRLLSLTENGTDDLVSTRSKAYKKLETPVDDLDVTQLVALIQEKPEILKNPIIAGEQKLATGFDLETIREFVPQTYRKKELARFFKILNGGNKLNPA